MSAGDGAAKAKLQWFMNHKISFNQLHSQLPQTLAHALADSPVGLLGWNAQLMTADAIGDKQLDDGFIPTNTALTGQPDWAARRFPACRAFYPSALYPLLARINAYLLRWLRKKHNRLPGTTHGTRRVEQGRQATAPVLRPLGLGHRHPRRLVTRTTRAV